MLSIFTCNDLPYILHNLCITLITTYYIVTFYLSSLILKSIRKFNKFKAQKMSFSHKKYVPWGITNPNQNTYLMFSHALKMINFLSVLKVNTC